MIVYFYFICFYSIFYFLLFTTVLLDCNTIKLYEFGYCEFAFINIPICFELTSNLIIPLILMSHNATIPRKTQYHLINWRKPFRFHHSLVRKKQGSILKVKQGLAKMLNCKRNIFFSGFAFIIFFLETLTPSLKM
jgi:hypothetical protein